MLIKYDVIVVGGGHAGCEAAAAAANLGSTVLLITMDMSKLGQMSCNPAMGGIAKGQIIREIDALGGLSGIVSDKSAVQFRMLNRSKGPAMWSPRTQNDRTLFTIYWREELEKIPNVHFWQDMVVGITHYKNKVTGVKTSIGQEIKAKTVILTSGTFLNGLIHIGMKNFGGGRSGEKASHGITEQLIELGFEAGRMKTGTPPRVDGRSLDYSKMEEQLGDEHPTSFSHLPNLALKKQLSCHITYTSPEVHEILKEGFDRSPMFNGTINSIGPRYCPSIEDKINRFADRERHQIFVEPEGWNTVEIYVNGFSTSLPEDIQIKAIQKIEGFADARIFRPGYAIEYDYFPPTQLTTTLETKIIENLFFAGQINGTTGYEEAACQGLMAGINAHQKINSLEKFTLSRDEAYIGVLIDDLITKGTDEPYRMFTSRAEHRILLRQDNADVRLTKKGHKLGLADQNRLDRVEQKLLKTNASLYYLGTNSIKPEQINPTLDGVNSSQIKQKTKLALLLSRPQININHILKLDSGFATLIDSSDDLKPEVLEQVEILIKYQGYIDRENETALKQKRLENIKLHDGFNYRGISSLSSEAIEKLTNIKPATIGQAARISGVSPADISILMVHIGR
jgi:tRNA uridine 5-carboxymethylaminomethyl modification enzyme